MSPAAAWRWCVVTGIATTIASTAFGWITGLAPCGPSGGLGSILAFELARSPAEIALLFGDESCRSTLIAAQARGLWLDGLAFIPSYAAFLMLAAGALRRSGAVVAWLAIAAVLTAALLDEFEGWLLSSILHPLPGTQTLVDMLYWEARAKFLLLALGGLGIGWLLISARKPLAGFAGAIMAGGALFSLWFVATAMHAPALMQGYRWSWTALLVIAIIGAIWPRAFSAAPDAPPPAPAAPSA